MVAADNVQLHMEAFSLTPGRDTGALTSINVEYTSLPEFLIWINQMNGNFDQYAALDRVTAQYKYSSDQYTPENVTIWSPTLRQRQVANDVTTEEYTNNIVNYGASAYTVDPPSSKIYDTLSQLLMNTYGPDGKLSPILLDPDDGTLPNMVYVPSYPTMDLLRVMRQIAASLGMPLVDTFYQMMLFRNFEILRNPNILDFSMSALGVDELRSEVEVNWYETKRYADTSTYAHVIYALDQVVSIESEEVQEITVQLDGIPDQLIQPYALDAIPIKDGTFNPKANDDTSVYCVTGSDGYIVSPGRWNARGGSIKVRRGEGPFDLIIRIQAPKDPDISPFTITEGADRPALYISSYGGIAFTRKTTRVQLPGYGSYDWGGAAVDPTTSPTPEPLDMPFVDTADRAYSAAMRYAAVFTAPRLTCNGTMSVSHLAPAIDPDTGKDVGVAQTVVGDSPVIMLPARKFYRAHNMWRITSVDYSERDGTVSFEGEAWTTFQDFNDNYAHLVYDEENDRYIYDATHNNTIAEFNAIVDRLGTGGGTGLALTVFNSLPLLFRPEGI